MVLTFINIRKVPRKMLKIKGAHLPRDLAHINEWKIMFDSYIVGSKGYRSCYTLLLLLLLLL